MGIANGILDEPRVDVEVSPGEWVTEDHWPVFDRSETLTFHADGSLTPDPPENGTVELINEPGQSEAEAVATGPHPNRLLCLTGSLSQAVRITGESRVNLRILPQGSVGQVGVALVDYGTQVRVRDDGEGNTLSESRAVGGIHSLRRRVLLRQRRGPGFDVAGRAGARMGSPHRKPAQRANGASRLQRRRDPGRPPARRGHLRRITPMAGQPRQPGDALLGRSGQELARSAPRGEVSSPNAGD